ncbi:MAG: hypothetical protein PHX51_01975 [Clostridia bacterium]|nr:hypothetical protein [Clostridia bacterium]
MKRSEHIERSIAFFLCLTIIGAVGELIWWVPLFDGIFQAAYAFADGYGLADTVTGFFSFYFIATSFTTLFYVVCFSYCSAKGYRLKKSNKYMR